MNTNTVQATTRTDQSSRAHLLFYAVAVAAWIGLILAERSNVTQLSIKVLLVATGLVAPIAGLLADPRRRAIAAREFLSYFYTPVGYVVLAVFAGITGLFFFFFTGLFLPGSPIDTEYLFANLARWVLIPVAPAISMRLFAEEQRSGNLEALVTAPLTDTQLVLGKWLGALSFLAVALTLSLLLVLLLEAYGNPDYGPIITGYFGLILIGGLYLALGTLTSALTHNQIISFLATIITIAILVPINYYVSYRYLSGAAAQATIFINPDEHNQNFAIGVLDTGDFVYMISATALFLVLAIKALESRKWR